MISRSFFEQQPAYSQQQTRKKQEEQKEYSCFRQSAYSLRLQNHILEFQSDNPRRLWSGHGCSNTNNSESKRDCYALYAGKCHCRWELRHLAHRLANKPEGQLSLLAQSAL